MKNLTIPSPNR